jgi:fatty-acid desaturase
MNIGEWLPVTATFSACLQNNHHHYSRLLRLSHDKSEYDFGFVSVKLMNFWLGEGNDKGAELPKDVPLAALNF